MTTTITPLLTVISPPHAASAAASEALAAGTSPELIRRHVTDDNICVLTFDRPDSSANIFDRNALIELNGHVNWVVCNANLRGLVLISAKSSIFIAGADLQSLSRARTTAELREMIELGQSVFNRVAALNIPTVAAIHGACVGGGFEICLACDARIASPDRATKIGLPETMLGILPAWGGCTRLPRLISLSKALALILQGQALTAKSALKCGMIDGIVPREYLLQQACRRIIRQERCPSPRKKSLLHKLSANPLVSRLIASRVKAHMLKKTRGHYPAPLKALEVIMAGLNRSVEDSLSLERDAILELARDETCRNLIRIFFLQERAKKLTGPSSDGRSHIKVEPIKRAAVIGAGVMGAGIAQWVSSREIPVTLRDIDAEAVAKGMTAIARLFGQGVERLALTKQEARSGLDRVTPSATDVPLQNTDIVIEAAVENMDLKRRIFAKLDQLAGPETILASNTSALSISELAAATARPERVVGIHFFNPVHKMQLVEVVVGQKTDPDVVRRAVKFVQQIGKLPVVVKDSPGFLVNRILMPYLIEAGHLFELGARVEDIDECMLDFGMPMGPLRLIDEVGLDVCNHVASDLSSKFSERMEAPSVLPKMIRDGLLGKKCSRGFYLHGKKGKADVNPEGDRYHYETSCANLTRDNLRTRMVLLMVNEAARCLEEELVDESADIDFSMIMGTGFAPFVGGPLRFADLTGIPQIVNEMNILAGKGESRFAPCRLLQTLAANGRTFYTN